MTIDSLRPTFLILTILLPSMELGICCGIGMPVILTMPWSA